MTLKTKAIIATVALAGAFSAGRYSVSQEPSLAITQETKKDVEKKEDTRTDVKTVITTTKEPTGATKTVTVIDRTTTKETGTKTKVDTQSNTSVTPAYRPKTNISIIGAYKLDSTRPEYGISVNRQILGPMTVGVFGLTGGTVGISVGLDF